MSTFASGSYFESDGKKWVRVGESDLQWRAGLGLYEFSDHEVAKMEASKLVIVHPPEPPRVPVMVRGQVCDVAGEFFTLRADDGRVLDFDQRVIALLESGVTALSVSLVNKSTGGVVWVTQDKQFARLMPDVVMPFTARMQEQTTPEKYDRWFTACEQMIPGEVPRG